MKRRLSICLVCVLCLMVVLTAFPVAAAEDSGTCGENVTWTLDNGVLTISGTGEMTSAPWEDYANDITTVVIEEGVTSVVDNAFSGFTSLTTVTFPATLTSLGDYAFYNCTSLKKIYFLGDVPKVKNFTFKGVTASAFYPLGNETWSKNALGYTGGSLLQQPNFGDKKVCGDNLTWAYKDGVLTISGTGQMYDAGDYDLWADYRSEIQKVVIESGVTSISHWAFTYCTALTEVSIPDTVTSIEPLAFSKCTSLKKITIPNSVTILDGGCFDRCSALEEVHIGSGVKQIEDGVFEGCTKLKAIYFYGDAPRVFMDTLTEKAITAYYPADNASWTEEVRGDYGDNITWLTFCGSNHQEQTITGKPATCTEDGLTDGKKCSVCGMVTVQQEKIPAAGHSYGDWVTVKEATEQEEGLQERTCDNCNKKEEQKLNKLPPKETEPPTEPSAEPPTETVTAPPTEAPTVPPTEAPTVPPTEAPTVPPTEAPTVPPTEAPTVPPTEAPTVPPTEAPTVPPTEAPTVPTVTQPSATEPAPAGPEDAGDGLILVWIGLGVIVIAGATVLIIKRKK